MKFKHHSRITLRPICRHYVLQTRSFLCQKNEFDLITAFLFCNCKSASAQKRGGGGETVKLNDLDPHNISYLRKSIACAVVLGLIKVNQSEETYDTSAIAWYMKESRWLCQNGSRTLKHSGAYEKTSF